MLLYVNACVRRDSRTDRLARALLRTLGPFEELRLAGAGLLPLNEERLDARTALVEAGRFEDPSFALARQFAAAEELVIAAPFWDGAFPALLKLYLENVYVTGITSKYAPDGTPVGLCRAGKLRYVTTAGGPFVPDFGYGYLSALAKTAFGIPETELYYAENLDLTGSDPERILSEAMWKYGL